MPFDDDEWKRIVGALEIFPDNYGKPGGGNAKRLRAFVLLLRFSGLRIGDATALETKRIVGNKLMLRTAKTGTVVWLPLPPVVVKALETKPRLYEDRYFSSGEATNHTATNKWRARLSKLFELAKIGAGHPHRFRDTAAVGWLLARLTIDEVATLLGHSNTRVTEQSYLPWVRERQVRLEDKLKASWNSV
jgi:integrase